MSCEQQQTHIYPRGGVNGQSKRTAAGSNGLLHAAGRRASGGEQLEWERVDAEERSRLGLGALNSTGLSARAAAYLDQHRRLALRIARTSAASCSQQLPLIWDVIA